MKGRITAVNWDWHESLSFVEVLVEETRAKMKVYTNRPDSFRPGDIVDIIIQQEDTTS